jgi:excisionase family DNA binding protein
LSTKSSSSLTDELLTTAQVAKVYGLSQSTLRKWRCIAAGPSFIKVGRAVRYRRSDLSEFLMARTYTSTAEADERS